MNTRLRNELARALRNRKFEAAEDGRVLFRDQKLWFGGSFLTDVNGQDDRLLPNTFTTEGLIYFLGTALQGKAQTTAFYLAPFSGNVEPDDTITGANFKDRQTEFTAYSEATRVAWDIPSDDLEVASIDNAASLATITISAANSTIWGWCLLTNQVKSATTGKAIACFKDVTARSNLQIGDKVNVNYGVAASDAS